MKKSQTASWIADELLIQCCFEGFECCDMGLHTGASLTDVAVMAGFEQCGMHRDCGRLGTESRASSQKLRPQCHRAVLKSSGPSHTLHLCPDSSTHHSPPPLSPSQLYRESFSRLRRLRFSLHRPVSMARPILVRRESLRRLTKENCCSVSTYDECRISMILASSK